VISHNTKYAAFLGVVNSCSPEVNYSYSRVTTGGAYFFSSWRLVITRSRVHGNVLGRFLYLWIWWTQLHEPKGTQQYYTSQQKWRMSRHLAQVQHTHTIIHKYTKNFNKAPLKECTHDTPPSRLTNYLV